MAPLSLSLLLALASPAVAGDAETWTAAFFQVAPTPGPTGPRLWTDLHMRRSAAGVVGLIRPGFGWQITPWASVWAGYAWIPTAADEAPLSQEHRAWEQVIFQGRFDRLSMSGRLRQEQRVRVGEPEVNHRLRLMPRVGVQLAGPLSLHVWDELFLSFNPTEWFDVGGYDQNRAFVGLSVDGFKGFRVEAGYLNIDLERGDASANNHALAVNLFFNLGPMAPKPASDQDPKPPEAAR